MSKTPILCNIGINNTEFGDNVTIIQPVNIYGCQLADNVRIGPFVEIQKHCVIGTGTRVQSHSFICEYVTIGRDCFIGHGVMFANDMFRDGSPDPDPNNWGRITIGDGVSIGSGATILAVEICAGAVIGAGSVVTRSITRKGVYAGNPARLLRLL
ncbi:acyltransferase [Entomohabitans teleogrylli]|uniref:acyltransferase n=1 Tax=Entomohabitans teleogrylli TaxID=1384589 RepID=UPI00073D529B|nr:acyltransferase [Entomohabitans teleogrylli]